MNPVLITIGTLEIKWYSVLILVGVIIGIAMLIKEGKRYNISKDFLFNLAFWTIVFGIIGARLYYVIFNWSDYMNDPISIIKIWNGGLAIHGGIISGLIFIKNPTKTLLEKFTLSKLAENDKLT